MYPLGLLFGLGFDTATEVGVLGISAAQASQGLSIWSILVFPALFTAGMTLVDTTDGILMLGAYGWAFVKPIRKLYYNLTITAVSVVVAVLIGGIEALNLIGDQARAFRSGRLLGRCRRAERRFWNARLSDRRDIRLWLAYLLCRLSPPPIRRNRDQTVFEAGRRQLASQQLARLAVIHSGLTRRVAVTMAIQSPSPIELPHPTARIGLVGQRTASNAELKWLFLMPIATACS